MSLAAGVESAPTSLWLARIRLQSRPNFVFQELWRHATKTNVHNMFSPNPLEGGVEYSPRPGPKKTAL